MNVFTRMNLVLLLIIVKDETDLRNGDRKLLFCVFIFKRENFLSYTCFLLLHHDIIASQHELTNVVTWYYFYSSALNTINCIRVLK